MDVIYGLLGMLLGDASEDTSATLLSLSNTVENCSAMRQSGCLPLLVQLIHTPDQTPAVRRSASRALHNIVRATQDPTQNNQELHVLELIQELREYSQSLRSNYVEAEDSLRHPIPAMSILFKLSFMETHKNTICLLGGLHAIAEIIEVDHGLHGSLSEDPNCLTLRRYAGMILTVLTLGDSKNNNSFLCSCGGFIKAWVAQLKHTNEELHQVTASVFRNLSWRADSNSKRVLREMGSVTCLTEVAMQTRREATLKFALSALWNLSAHCATNKVDICAVDGALEFLIDMLTFKSPSKRLAIVENASGILRNVSSHVAIEEKYREILRRKSALHILVRLLRSSSLIIVSNVCGTLWNLSARCPKDQKTLWELGAVPILRNLVQSKHKMISSGACHALRNLLAAKGGNMAFQQSLPTNFRSMHASHASVKPEITLKLESRSPIRASCHSAIENTSDSTGEEQTLPSKPWDPHLSRPPSSPLGDEDSAASPLNDSAQSQSDGEKLDYPKSPYSERRKGSPVGSPYFERSCSTSVAYEADGDQPVDYSKKYIESHTSKQRSNIKMKARREKEFSEEDSNLYGDYAETDLDQPTDYSLRYAEDDTDDEEKGDTRYFTGTEQEDTVKTYCTEGTPYETPFNFSTATSMSDLRLEDPKEGEALKKLLKKTNGTIEEFNECNQLEQKEISEESDLAKSDILLETSNPEVPAYYYDERASGGISRVNSLSSLNSAMVTKSEAVTNDASEESESLMPKEEKCNSPEETKSLQSKEVQTSEEKIMDREAKVVTFGGENHYAEETPLMFSRCSSLGSLSGFEQHSIHDDRSSIISDFSRRTSGAVSPSELPDSPTQTIPPSPRHSKNPEFHTRSEDRPLRLLHFPKCLYQKSKNSVFEDDTAAFKEESTPIEFSAATSLSSLTIDDEPKLPEIPESTFASCEEANEVPSVPSPAVPSPAASQDELGLKENFENLEINDKDQEQGSDCDGEDDEDILAACINMGMQNNRYSENFKKSEVKSYPPSVTNLIRYQTSSTLDRLDANLFEARTPVSPIKTKLTLDVPITPDTMHVYCTEDTPADISPVGSQSNLSALSMPSILEDFEKPDELRDTRNDLSDDSSNLSGDDEKILDECIQSGMPKPISPNGLKKSESFLSSLSDYSIKNAIALRDNRERHVRRIIGQDQQSNNSSDDSPNQSDDDAILAECIESAMPKARLSTLSKPSTSRQSDSLKKDFDSSRSSDQMKSPQSEDSLSLSEEEEEMILAQCIRSGMPKASTSIKNYSSMTPDDSRRIYNVSISSPGYSPRHLTRRKDLAPQGARDEMSDFVTEDTPCNFSVVSEISSLSINSND